MATVVAAPRASVWSALADPEQLVHWRPGATGIVGDAPREPTPGRVLRLRCRLHEVPVVLEELTVEAAREERLRSELRFGLFRCEETFTLAPSDPDGGHTRVGLRLAAPSETPLVGASLDRFAVRRFATELAGHSLAALRDWCEHGRPATQAARSGAARSEPEANEVTTAAHRVP